MGDRSFDSEETQRIGEAVVPPLASAYADLAGLISSSGKGLDGNLSPELSETYLDYHRLQHNASQETSQTLGRLGPTLVQIAEDDRLVENEINQAFEQAADEIQSDAYGGEGGYTPMSEGEKPEEMDETPGSYDDDLDGRTPNPTENPNSAGEDD
ncbi:hypothetical protein [Glycomyces buryatensis]|uniref:Uncharacterized protein n=1 Tax=Glycomyces buryatensis TaxID=2570927 RepID=A0A4S8Q061_9ACTN|nr:hypothetical protein [Glycomyces buryatensis]THV33939.1 hypothetical protein FAB82_24500 [Glycomyces buryatensis]